MVVATPHLGASTYEAQQRVAVEISEQFIALSNRNKPGENFIVNGAVNAPVLSATMVESNVPWITLTQHLGRVLGGLAKQFPSGTKIGLTTSGKGLEKATFLSVPVLAGLLSTQTTSGINLINAPAYGKDAGLSVEFKHKDGEPAVELTVANQTVVGTLGANQSPILLSINEGKFLPSGVAVGSNVTIFQGNKGQFDLATVINEVKQHNGEILSVAVANSKQQSYVLIQTLDDLPPINISGLTIC